MFTETSFKRCFVNGKKSGVATYNGSEGDPAALLLFFGSSLGAGNFDVVAKQNEIKSAGGSLSLHQFSNAWALEGSTVADIQKVIPGASVVWEGSKEYQERVNAAVGSRGGSSTTTGNKTADNTGSAVSTPEPSTSAASVAPADSFRVPAVAECPDLAGILGLMPQLSASVNTWASSVASSVLSGDDVPALPDNVAGAAAFVPALDPALEIYKNIIIRSAEDWKEEQARIEREREEKRKALEAAKLAAANGKTLVKLSDGSTVEVTGKVHPAFAECFEDLKEFRAIYLQGPAGTGKSFMCRQLAESLGVGFYSTGKAELKYDLLGSYDANGKHVFTSFTHAWIEGGVCLLDEFDRYACEALTCINDALANGVCEIPGLGMVKRHENFYCVAAGNTYGYGPDTKYNAAQKQDYSVLTRFLSKIHIDYCREMDMIVTGDDNELCDFAAAVRAAIEKTGIEIDLAIRTLKPLQSKSSRCGCVRALECCLFAGLDKTAISQIASRCEGSGKWFDALKELAA